MNSKLYKRLFEVQIMHDYFLTTNDDTSFFKRNKDQKAAFINTKLVNNLYNTNSLFSIKPTADTLLRMNEYNIVFSKTPLGFIVGVEVLSENVGGATLYKPVLKVPTLVNLAFEIQSKLSFFKTITNHSFSFVSPAVYYFSNKDKTELDEDTAPTYKSLQLARELKTHQPGELYEMGELIDFAGVLREAIEHTDGSDPLLWEDIKDRRFVSNADRVLLPHKFGYSLQKEAAITTIDFVLEDQDNNVVKTVSKTGSEVLERVSLNFAKVDETNPDSPDILAGTYTLKVTPDGNPEIRYTVHLNDSLYDRNHLGVIDIRFDEPNSPFSLLDAAGFLKTRITALDNRIPHPVFELRFKNRRTYWRYNKEGDFSAPEIATTAPHLTHLPEQLTTIRPKALTAALIPFNPGALMLPHPKVSSIRIGEEKIFSEIFINQSNRLLNS